MRCDQFQGLNPWARKFLRRRIAGAVNTGQVTLPNGKVITYEQTKVSIVRSVEVVGYVKSRMYSGRVAPRHRYTLWDGRVFEEVLERTIHSGGPNYFLALRHPDGALVQESLWTKEQLAKHYC